MKKANKKFQEEFESALDEYCKKAINSNVKRAFEKAKKRKAKRSKNL